MKRTLALTAAFSLTATIVFLPGDAGATGHEAVAAPGAELPATQPVLTPVAEPLVPAPPAAPLAPAAGEAPVAGEAVAVAPAAPTTLPAPVPAPVAAVLTPPAPTADDHMAELCAAREVFCHVDSSGRYTES